MVAVVLVAKGLVSAVGFFSFFFKYYVYMYVRESSSIFTLRWLFLRVLTFDITTDWPKNAKFCTCELILPYTIPNVRTCRLFTVSTYKLHISTRNVCFKPKSQKSIPANICHPKVMCNAFILCVIILRFSWDLNLGLINHTKEKLRTILHMFPLLHLSLKVQVCFLQQSQSLYRGIPPSACSGTPSL